MNKFNFVVNIAASPCCIYELPIITNINSIPCVIWYVEIPLWAIAITFGISRNYVTFNICIIAQRIEKVCIILANTPFAFKKLFIAAIDFRIVFQKGIDIILHIVGYPYIKWPYFLCIIFSRFYKIHWKLIYIESNRFRCFLWMLINFFKTLANQSRGNH